MGYCKICSKETKKDYELCSTCENKRKASKIILKLQDKINFEEKINNTILYSLGYTDFIRIKDLIWTLEETNLINKVDKDNYTWIELDKIEKFVKKYDKNKGINLKINSNKQDITHIKCQRCGQSLTNPKKKQKCCKKCKKINKTLKNIKFIQKYDENINITNLIEQTQKEQYQIEGIIFDLIENDLIKKIDDENYQQIPENIENYLKEHEELNDKFPYDEKQNIENKIIKTNSFDNKNEDNSIFEKSCNDNSDNQLEKLFVSDKKNPKITSIQPSGWLLYKKIDDNIFDIIEYSLSSQAINDMDDGYELSKAYKLNDYKNIKLIKELNKYYIYQEENSKYESIKLYTLHDIKKGTVINNETMISSVNKDEAEIILDGKKDISINDNNDNPNNQELFDEFFEKCISISEDEQSWITYDELFNIFTEYVQEEYQTKIPELGDNGFNQLLYSKIKKISGIKTKNVNSTMEFNLIVINRNIDLNGMDSLSELSIKNKDYLDSIDNITSDSNEVLMFNRMNEINGILLKYIDENLKILDREATSNDLTQMDIFELFTQYLAEQNKSLSYVVFAYSFQKIINDINGIKKKLINRKVFYNCVDNKSIQLIPKENEKFPKKNSIEEVQSEYNLIKNNNELFDEFFDKHLEITLDDLWIKKQRLYTLFNNYTLNMYNIDISENGLDGFNSILQYVTKKSGKVRKRIRNGKIEYNFKYVPLKKHDNLNESIKTPIVIENNFKNYNGDYTYKNEKEFEDDPKISKILNNNVDDNAQIGIEPFNISTDNDIINYLENNNVIKIDNNIEYLFIYNEVIGFEEYKKLMELLNKSIELLTQLNIVSLNENEYNLNLILKVTK